MIGLLLLNQIAQLFICIFLGWLSVKCRLLRSEDSRVLSMVTLYLVTPCLIVGAFQIECTPDMLRGLGLSLGAAVLIHVLLFVLTYVCRRPLHLNAVEQASVIYSNAGNLIIPIVTAILGKEWVIFTSMFIIVQLPLLWSHCRFLLSGEGGFSLKKVLGNVNILSILVGAALFFLGIPLPGVVTGAMDSMSGMIGPLSMIVAGMLMGDIDLKHIFTLPSIWKVAALRLVVFPLAVLAVLYLIPGVPPLVALVCSIMCCLPSASLSVVFAQEYGCAPEYASRAVVQGMLLMIITIPLFITLAVTVFPL